MEHFVKESPFRLPSTDGHEMSHFPFPNLPLLHLIRSFRGFNAVINQTYQIIELGVTFDFLIGAEGGGADHDGVRRGTGLRWDAVSGDHVHTPGHRSSC